ncbi:MAG TPA: hypothetical protein DD643_02395 [Synechococcus sp. UBA8638]|nr:hypothetical protein [Synechococcus sp. UBA8638]
MQFAVLVGFIPQGNHPATNLDNLGLLNPALLIGQEHPYGTPRTLGLVELAVEHGPPLITRSPTACR